MFSNMNERSKILTNSINSNNLISEENLHCNLELEEKGKSENQDDFNLNIMSNIYSREDPFFKKNIEKLNQKFYSETNKYLTNKAELEKSHDNLFCILFKQISFYGDEVEKLTLRLKEKDENMKIYKNRIEEFNKKDSNDKDIPYYKNAIRLLEKKMSEKVTMEEKLKKENESFKRQINFYKEKLKVDYINPIKKMDLGSLNSSLKMTSPFKITKNKNNSNENPISNSKKVITNYNNITDSSFKKTHKKNNSNNLTAAFFKDIEKKKEDIFEITQDNLRDRKRTSSMNLKKKIINTKNNFIDIFANSMDKTKTSILNSSKGTKEDSLAGNSKTLRKETNNKLNVLLMASETSHKKTQSINSKNKLNQNVTLPRDSLKESSFLLSNKLKTYKHLDEKIVQNNCQNIYNVNINPIDERPKTPANNEEVQEIFSLIAKNFEDELNLLKNEEIYLKLLKEDISESRYYKEDNNYDSILTKEENLSINNHQFTEYENMLNYSRENKEYIVSDIEDIYSDQKNRMENEYKTIMHTDIAEKPNNNFKLKFNKNNLTTTNINKEVRFNNSLSNCTNTKNRINTIAKTPNKTPKKINNNFSFANKFNNSSLLKSSNNKDVKQQKF